MEGWQIAIVLKPLGLLLLFIPLRYLSRWLHKEMPDGRLKKVLLFSWKV